MATIKAALSLYDGMTGPLRSINQVLNTVVDSFENLQGVSSAAVNPDAIGTMRHELERINSTFDGIEQAENNAKGAQDKFNGSLNTGVSSAEKMLSKIKDIAATAGIALGAKGIFDLSDSVAGIKARLSLIVDDGGSISEFEEKIKASALRVGADYFNTADSIISLGLNAERAFSGVDEIIAFTELMNKSFAVGNASATAQTSAMYQLTQAMASGRLQGDEYKSIIENAPLLAGAIEDYMVNVQGAQGSMKDWASEGLLTSEVIKNSLFMAADETEERFEALGLNFGRLWNNIKTWAVDAFEPVLNGIAKITSSERFQKVADGIKTALIKVADVALWVFEVMTLAANFVIDNWGWIEPIVIDRAVSK